LLAEEKNVFKVSFTNLREYSSAIAGAVVILSRWNRQLENRIWRRL